MIPLLGARKRYLATQNVLAITRHDQGAIGQLGFTGKISAKFVFFVVHSVKHCMQHISNSGLFHASCISYISSAAATFFSDLEVLVTYATLIVALCC